jgi:cell division protein FtsN
MPIGKMHKKRFGRNLIVAGVLVLFILAAFFITMYNMQGQTWTGS